MTERALRVRDARVTYRAGRQHATILTGIDLDLPFGGVLGLVGESGCGKSTLARVLAGLQRPSAGTLTVDGADVWGMRTSDRTALLAESVAMVFQDPASSLNPRMSVARIVRDPLDIRGVGTAAERARRVEELLDMVGLPASTAQRRPAELSGGQRQRVAIARALALRPRYLIADEPTSALDVSVRAQVLNLLTELRSELGLAMILISHDIQTVRYLADDIAVMYLGHIVERGPAADVTERPRHPYTAALFSATPALTRARTDRIVLEGNAPTPADRPPGCPLSTRCWRVTDDCRDRVPDLEPAGDGDRTVRCLYPLAPERIVATSQ